MIQCLDEEVKARNYRIRPDRLKNGTGNSYQIDAVIYDANQNPVIIIDPKYIRYTKHNRDKASWLCVAHYNLRKTYPTIRKSIAVLAGRWSVPSKALIRSFGVEALEVPFDNMVAVLEQYGVEFDWLERDRETPRQSLAVFRDLDDKTREQMGADLTEGIDDDLKDSVNCVLDVDPSTLPTRISSVEVLLRTDRDELMLRTFDSVATSLQFMSGLVYDRSDMTDILASE